MTSLSCTEHDVVWGGLLYWGLEALETTDYKLEEESEKNPLFYIDFAAVTEAQRKTHSKRLIYVKGCGSSLKVYDGTSVWALQEAAAKKKKKNWTREHQNLHESNCKLQPLSVITLVSIKTTHTVASFSK